MLILLKTRKYHCHKIIYNNCIKNIFFILLTYIYSFNYWPIIILQRVLVKITFYSSHDCQNKEMINENALIKNILFHKFLYEYINF